MEYASAISPHTHGHEHIAQLRAGGISNNAFDVILNEANSSGKEGCGAADDNHNITRDGCKFKQWRHAGNEKYTRRHHCGSVDQS